MNENIIWHNYDKDILKDFLEDKENSYNLIGAVYINNIDTEITIDDNIYIEHYILDPKGDYGNYRGLNYDYIAGSEINFIETNNFFKNCNGSDEQMKKFFLIKILKSLEYCKLNFNLNKDAIDWDIEVNSRKRK